MRQFQQGLVFGLFSGVLLHAEAHSSALENGLARLGLPGLTIDEARAHFSLWAF